MKDHLDIDNPDLDELFEKYRKSPESYVFAPLADACRKLGRVEEALEICEKGLARHPTYVSGHVVKGKCLYDLGHNPAAEGVFRDVLQFDQNNLVALKYLGMIQLEAGDVDGAKERFRHILELDPDNKEIQSKLETMDVFDQEVPKEIVIEHVGDRSFGAAPPEGEEPAQPHDDEAAAAPPVETAPPPDIEVEENTREAPSADEAPSEEPAVEETVAAEDAGGREADSEKADEAPPVTEDAPVSDTKYDEMAADAPAEDTRTEAPPDVVPNMAVSGEAIILGPPDDPFLDTPPGEGTGDRTDKAVEREDADSPVQADRTEGTVATPPDIVTAGYEPGTTEDTTGTAGERPAPSSAPEDAAGTADERPAPSSAPEEAADAVNAEPPLETPPDVVTSGYEPDTTEDTTGTAGERPAPSSVPEDAAGTKRPTPATAPAPRVVEPETVAANEPETADPETSDELATITLADIYVAQGYKNKAIRIYREVLKKQPNNQSVQQRLDKLVEEMGADPEGESLDDDSPAPAVQETSAAEPPVEEPAPEGDEHAIAPEVEPEPQETDRGRRIEEKHSLDYFKRWLNHMRD